MAREGPHLRRAAFPVEQSRATVAPDTATPGPSEALFADRGNPSGFLLYSHPGGWSPVFTRTKDLSFCFCLGSRFRQALWVSGRVRGFPLTPDVDPVDPLVLFLGWFPVQPRAATSTVKFAPCQKDAKFQSVGPGFPISKERLQRTWRNARENAGRGGWGPGGREVRTLTLTALFTDSELPEWLWTRAHQ